MDVVQTDDSSGEVGAVGDIFPASDLGQSQLDPQPPPSQTPSATAHNISTSFYFMPSRPIEVHPKKDNRHKAAYPLTNNTRQHGHPHHHHSAASRTADVLLSIPSESLTHVTSFLDPPDLLAIARTCKQLHAHVADDNTWRRAYVYQYLGVTPESDLRDGTGDKTLMLRREESSWRREFVLRYNLRRYVITFLRKGEDLVRGRACPGVDICASEPPCFCNEVGYAATRSSSLTLVVAWIILSPRTSTRARRFTCAFARRC
ncbi:hypothetical protein C8Q80DRAFT_908355 [Daedaleopsis nitida]|nr:hypothetical protein C8Q80DRAFT_908355 [Daedaleopsis nitida]